MTVACEPGIHIGRDYHVFEQQGMKLMISVDRSRVVKLADDNLFTVLAEYEQLNGDAQLGIEAAVSRQPWSTQEKAETLEALAQIAPLTLRPPGIKPYVPDVSKTTVEQIRFNHVTLMVSGACNLRCKYCYTGLQIDKHDEALMSEDVARQAVQLICRHITDRHHSIGLTFFGGEPLLNFPLVRAMIHHVEAKAIELGKTPFFTLTTNGTLLTPEIIEFLEAHRCVILVSLDGPQQVHDAVRVFPDGSGSHAIVLRNLKLIKQMTGHCHVRATRMPDGPPWEQLLDYFEALGVTPPVSTAAVMDTEDNIDSASLGDPRQVFEALNGPAPKLREREYQQLVSGEAPMRDAVARWMGEFNRSDSLAYKYQCSAFSSHLAVGPDGALYPCHRFWPMPAYELGNVRDGIDIDKFRAGLQQFHEVVAQKCIPCWARFLCGGECPRHRATAQGFRPPHDYECEASRRRWEQAAAYFVRMAEEHPDVLCNLANPPRQDSDYSGHDRPPGLDVPS